MSRNGEKLIEYHRSRYKTSEKLFEDDRELIKEFDEELQIDSSKGNVRHSQLLSYITTYAKHRTIDNCEDAENEYTQESDYDHLHEVSLQEIIDNPKAAKSFLQWTEGYTHEENGKQVPISNKTKEHYRGAIRQFADLVCEDGMPKHISEIRATVKNKDYNPTPHPNSILYWDEHVTPMLDHKGVNTRDTALIATAWDSGARPWELHDIKYNDLIDRGDHIELVIEDGKTGTRKCRLITSTPYLRKWLKEHPIHDHIGANESPPNDTFLWSLLDEPRRLETIANIPNDAGERAGVRRKTNLRKFRKSRASVLAASSEVGEHSLRVRFGWKNGSQAPAHYKARFDDSADQDIANADGADIEIEDEHEDPAPVKCPQCENWTPRHLSDCFWCQTEIVVDDTEGVTTTIFEKDLKREQQKRKLLGEVAQGEIDPDSLDRTLPFAEMLEEETDVVKRAHEFLEAEERK